MTTSVSSLITDSHTVPEWVERNAKLFRACPPGVHRKSKEITTTSNIRTAGADEEYAAASMAAMLINTDDGVGWIEAPAGLQPPSYYRDLSNHPNILATFVYTARRKAGFLPNLVGQQLSLEQWNDYTNKFNAWLNELDAFWFYVTLTNQEGESISNSASTSDAIVDALSKFVLVTANEVDDEAKEEAKQRIKKTFELASEYMVEKNIGESTSPPTKVKACFQHEAFPIVGPSKPNVPISLVTTTLSKSKKNPHSALTIEYGSASMNRFIFQLNSANVIANAEALSNGTTLLSTKVYVDYINGPLDEWADADDAPPDTSK
ncbi:hypothetical protein GOP47_0020703 [Adiantum capillus-veneris]|uniref:Uncharacterized protein n=1 Tax=Adiantum capillus-veneris TaxID=13818 RepID=A0A9D4U9N8_ADICA|nr:hypothetical protein GOP47_0020703 [Adiantum capillus-veneris]